MAKSQLVCLVEAVVIVGLLGANTDQRGLSVSQCCVSADGVIFTGRYRKPGSAKRGSNKGCCSQVRGSGLNEDGRDRVP